MDLRERAEEETPQGPPMGGRFAFTALSMPRATASCEAAKLPGETVNNGMGNMLYASVLGRLGRADKEDC